MKGISGEETPFKQKDFKALLQHHINICSSIIPRQSWASQDYRYFDMFGGPGIIHENGETIYGSPVIFLNTIREFSLPYLADIVEQDMITFLDLQAIINSPLVRLHNGDSQTVYKRFLSPNKKQYGLLYLDPDMSEDGFDLSFTIAKDFSTYYPMMDILFYISANNIKRIAGVKNTPDLQERLSPISKKHWVIRTLKTKFQYTFLIGTNFIAPFVWSNKEFYSIQSPEGKAIFDKANFTREELKKKIQPELTGLTGLMQNIYSIPHLELSERKRFGGLMAFAKSAIKDQLRKYIT